MEMENAPSSLTLAHDFTVRGGSRGSSNSQDLITSEREEGKRGRKRGQNMHARSRVHVGKRQQEGQSKKAAGVLPLL